MKTLLPSILCLLGFSVFAQNPLKPEWAYQNLNGKVKSITSYTFRVRDSAGTMVRDTVESKEIDEYTNDGYMWKESYYSPANKLMYSYERLYDKNHYVKQRIHIESSKWRHFSDTSKEHFIKTIEDFTYLFDTKGNEIEVQSMSDGKPGTRAYNKFDSRGNVIECKQYNSGDSLCSVEASRYDSIGNLIEQHGYWDYISKERIIYGYAYKYDGKGKRSEIDDLNSDGSVQNIITFDINKLDSKGNCIRETDNRNDIPCSIVDRTIEYY